MKIRQAKVAGQFYEGDAERLRQEIDKLLKYSDKEMITYSNTLGMIAPHAGYMFSGKQAAKAYRSVKGMQPEIVCVISPSHREYFPFCSVYDGDAYETPLGLVEIADEARDYIGTLTGISISENGHRGEHAIEVHLPFLQTILKTSFLLLPVVMGEQSEKTINELSDVVAALASHYGSRILFIASTDLSHFHDYHTARHMDHQFIQYLEQLDDKMIWSVLENHNAEACGGGPVTAMIKGLKTVYHELKIETLGYMNSGDVISDKTSVVGYTSAVLYQ